jgi:hypothetical protein
MAVGRRECEGEAFCACGVCGGCGVLGGCRRVQETEHCSTAVGRVLMRGGGAKTLKCVMTSESATIQYSPPQTLTPRVPHSRAVERYNCYFQC